MAKYKLVPVEGNPFEGETKPAPIEDTTTTKPNYKLVPVEGNPFEEPPKPKIKLVPVGGNPFEQTDTEKLNELPWPASDAAANIRGIADTITLGQADKVGAGIDALASLFDVNSPPMSDVYNKQLKKYEESQKWAKQKPLAYAPLISSPAEYLKPAFDYIQPEFKSSVTGLPKPTMLSAATDNAATGFTFGLDELAKHLADVTLATSSALPALFDERTFEGVYNKTRDWQRFQDRYKITGEKAHPIASLAGGLLGAIASPITRLGIKHAIAPAGKYTIESINAHPWKSLLYGNELLNIFGESPFGHGLTDVIKPSFYQNAIKELIKE